MPRIRPRVAGVENLGWDWGWGWGEVVLEAGARVDDGGWGVWMDAGGGMGMVVGRCDTVAVAVTVEVM